MILQNKALIIGLVASSLLTACGSEDATNIEVVRPIRAIQIGSAEQITGRNFPGVARATQEVDLSFRVPGSLKEMRVKVGQEVRLGDVLSVLDKRDFEVAENNTKAGLANARAQLKNAKIAYDRVVRIQKADSGAVSQSVVDQRQAGFEKATALFASARTSLNAAQDRLSYATLKAPFEGIIVQRFVDNFQDVNANVPIFRLIDISKIEMDVNIPENLRANLPYVTNIMVTFDAFPHVVIPATVNEVSNEASQSTRTYRVGLIMTPPLGVEILPGMSGHATGEVNNPDQKNQYIVIPLSAVFSSNDSKKTYVWKYDTDRQLVRKQQVEIGRLTDQGLIIATGLMTGDWIATAGVHFLIEGQKVRLLDKEGAE